MSVNQVEQLWIKNPQEIFAEEDARGGIVISGDTITELVPSGAKPKTNFDRIFDASNHVVLPGLINTHHHFYQTLTRSTPSALNKALFPWLKSLYPIWSKLTPEDIKISTKLSIAELLLSGCTTTSDHHYVFPEGLEDALAIQYEEIVDSGIRATITRGSMCLGEEDGGLPPQTVIQSEDEIISSSESAITRFHDASPGAMVQVALAPCSPFSVTEEIMLGIADLAKKSGVRTHTHLAETEDETVFCKESFGLSPLDYLEKVNWLNNRTWLAHGIYFSDEEIDRLGKSKVGITHCPTSNMILGSGICPVPKLIEAGCPVGLGVDGSSSNDCSNMIEEVRMAFLLQRLNEGADRISHYDALTWATSGSASCLGRDDVGVIAVGKQADLALFSLDEPRFSGFGEPMAAIVLSGAKKADFVMVAGKWLVEKREIVDLDMESLLNDHRTSALNLAKRSQA